MRDVFESRQSDLEGYLGAFECLPGQNGLLVAVDGQAQGLDVVSIESAYSVLHPRLLKSYAMDAILSSAPEDTQATGETAKAFISAAADNQAKRYDSVGLGRDIRFGGRRIVGSALLHDDKVIHIAAFNKTGADDSGNMSGRKIRMSFRS